MPETYDDKEIRQVADGVLEVISTYAGLFAKDQHRQTEEGGSDYSAYEFRPAHLVWGLIAAVKVYLFTMA